MFSTKTFYAQWRLGLLYSNLFCYHKSLVIIIYTDLKSKYNKVQSSLPFLILCSSDDRHQRTPRKFHNWLLSLLISISPAYISFDHGTTYLVSKGSILQKIAF